MGNAEIEMEGGGQGKALGREAVQSKQRLVSLIVTHPGVLLAILWDGSVVFLLTLSP